MKLVKTDVKQLTRTLDGSGLFECNLHYKVENATGTMNYNGPKMPANLWHEMLAFFKWSFDETKSETQVRLFVNSKRGLWKIWAFPQEAGTGLSAKEISNEDAKFQRANLFTDHDDWMAWGTVHHHCNIGAFQSHTDENDEKDVNGLHITIGNLEDATYSMHARLYHKGDLYEPDMSELWDIGDVGALLPVDVHDRVARWQMCQPAPGDTKFPAQWKANLIKVERPKIEIPRGIGWGLHTEFYTSQTHPPATVRTRNPRIALHDIMESLKGYQLGDDGLQGILEHLLEDNILEVIIDGLREHNVGLKELVDALREHKQQQLLNEFPEWMS